jgi:hypothetical protein
MDANKGIYSSPFAAVRHSFGYHAWFHLGSAKAYPFAVIFFAFGFGCGLATL